jgi:membrane AbrB-like protein
LALMAGGCGQLLKFLAVPAGEFLGPMLVAIGFGVCGANIRVPRYFFKLGQGFVGILAAHSMTMAVLTSLAQSWPIMLFATVLTVCLSALVGLVMVRIGGIPASTSAWGVAPGAASVMVAMSEDFGADSRVVATMQYVRVVCVVLIGALTSHWLGAPAIGGDISIAHNVLPPFNLMGFVHTITVVVAGVALGNSIPAGALLMPLLIGGALHLSGVLQINLPGWVLATAYGTVGCYVGLGFDRQTIYYVWKRIPAMILGALMTIGVCALAALAMAKLLGKDFLSMYLATSPGGLDSMAIIAVETHSDVGLVLAMQTLRLFVVLLTGAFIARLIIRVAGRWETAQP